MTYEAEIEPFNQQRDDLVKVHAAEFKINLRTFFAHLFQSTFYIAKESKSSADAISKIHEIN